MMEDCKWNTQKINAEIGDLWWESNGQLPMDIFLYHECRTYNIH